MASLTPATTVLSIGQAYSLFLKECLKIGESAYQM
jgi:hypothetical protein